MYGYWTMDAFFISTFIFVGASILNWFLREKFGYADFRDEYDDEGGNE